jgi:hypothetical protein
MITITGKVNKQGHMGTALVPANHSEANGASAWGLVIACGLVLLTSTLVCLLLFAA